MDAIAVADPLPAAAIIDHTIELIRQGWVTKAWATTDDGTEVDLYDPSATRWCGEAALTLATEHSRAVPGASALDREAAWQAACCAAELLYGVTDLSDINDHFGHEAMLAVFTKARELLFQSPARHPAAAAR